MLGSGANYPARDLSFCVARAVAMVTGRHDARALSLSPLRRSLRANDKASDGDGDGDGSVMMRPARFPSLVGRVRRARRSLARFTGDF